MSPILRWCCCAVGGGNVWFFSEESKGDQRTIGHRVLSGFVKVQVVDLRVSVCYKAGVCMDE